jgi:sugar/nucleoside kinase (ribokinase family)
MKILIVGNITIDEIGDRIRVGGTGYYGGKALAEYLNEEVYVATNIDENFRGLIKGVLESSGIRVIELGENATPVFVISGGKAVGFKGRSPRIKLQDLEHYTKIYRFDVIVLGPIMREIELQEIPVAASWSPKILSLDIQGVVRRVEDSSITLRWSKEIEEYLSYLDVVHGNLREFCFSNNLSEVLRTVREWSTSIKTVILVSLDEKGLYLIHRGEVLYIRPLHVNVVDEVGAGDILLTVTSYYMAKGLTPLAAALRGAAAAMLKVENAYREWFNAELIESYAKELEPHVEALSL